MEGFVAEVDGIDLMLSLEDHEYKEIEAALVKYGALVFRNQMISDEQQLEFTSKFGTIEKPFIKSTQPVNRRISEGLNDVSNLDFDGNPLPEHSNHQLARLSNTLWHSDSSFRKPPAKYTILSARKAYRGGGNTEICDLRAAFDALDQELKDEVADLMCEHSVMYTQMALGVYQFTEQHRKDFEAVRHNLVRKHPITGRKSLFLSSHGGAISEYPLSAARILLNDLFEHSSQRPFVYSHAWRDGDLVMFDNQQTMHRVRRYNQNQVRDMRRSIVSG